MALVSKHPQAAALLHREVPVSRHTVPGTRGAGVKVILFYLMVLGVRHRAGFGGAVLLLPVTSVEVA